MKSSSDSQVTYIVQPEDKGGVFTCLAANAAGNDSADTVVVIASELAYYKVFYTLLKYFKSGQDSPQNDEDIYLMNIAVKTTPQNHNILKYIYFTIG